MFFFYFQVSDRENFTDFDESFWFSNWPGHVDTATDLPPLEKGD